MNRRDIKQLIAGLAKARPAPSAEANNHYSLWLSAVNSLTTVLTREGHLGTELGTSMTPGDFITLCKETEA